ncbi:MAG: tetratricopeptide repeat protein [Thermodesulfobacteriota bacterium]
MGFKNEGARGESSPAPEKSRLNRPVFHYLSIIGIGLMIYSNTFHGPFQWDENDFLVQNPIVKNINYFLSLSKAKGVDPDFYLFFKTRYISYLTFALNYWIHGFDVLGYHLVNLAIHLLNAILVYLFTFLAFKTPFLRESSLKNHARHIALFAALLFVSHPIQTEAVTYVFQRHASFVTSFYLLSMVFYIQGRLKGEEGSSHLHSALFYGLSLISALSAMKTKENAFTLPFSIMIFEFFFFTGSIRIRMLYLIPLLLASAVIPFTLIGIDKPIGQIMSQISDPSSLLVKEVPKEIYLFTQLRVILTYIRLLFFPIHQNLDYHYPLYSSFFAGPIFLPFLFYLGLLGLAAYLFFRSRQSLPELRVISFGIVWFFVTLSVESSIIPLQMIICEYRVYLPSVGVFVAATTSFFMMIGKLDARSPQLKKIGGIFLALIIILLSILTYARNVVWQDDVRMWEDVTKKSFENPRGHYNLGLAYGKKGRWEDALKEFETTLKLNPHHNKARNNLGIIYHRQGRLDDAMREFRAVLQLNPNDTNARYNLGLVFLRSDRSAEAIREFQTVLQLNPDDADAHNNLGILFAKQSRWDEAIREFQSALRINPHHVNARNNLRKVPGGDHHDPDK